MISMDSYIIEISFRKYILLFAIRQIKSEAFNIINDFYEVQKNYRRMMFIIVGHQIFALKSLNSHSVSCEFPKDFILAILS